MFVSKRKYDELNKELKKTSNERYRLSRENESLKEECNSLVSSYNEMRLQHKALLKMIENKDKKLNKIAKESKELDDAVEVLTIAIENEQERDNEICDLTFYTEALSEMVDELEAKLSDFEKANQILEKNLDKANEKLSNLKNTGGVSKNTHKKLLDAFKKEAKNLPSNFSGSCIVRRKGKDSVVKLTSKSQVMDLIKEFDKGQAVLVG